jgi:hypothetical protein
MNQGNRLVIPFIVIAALSVGACSILNPNQPDRKQATEEKARNVSGDVWAAQNQIDATMMSMNNLMSADAPQLKQAYERYSTDVDRLKKQSAVVAADGEFLQKQSDTYLADWHKQSSEINDTSLRVNSEQDRKTLRNRFTTTQDAYERAQEAMSRLVGNFEDVRTVLRNDLTIRGVQGIGQTDVVKNAEANARQTKNALREVQSQSTALAEALSPAAQPVAASNNASDTSSQGSSNK